jgi:hypothetical protein
VDGWNQMRKPRDSDRQLLHGKRIVYLEDTVNDLMGNIEDVLVVIHKDDCVDHKLLYDLDMKVLCYVLQDMNVLDMEVQDMLHYMEVLHDMEILDMDLLQDMEVLDMEVLDMDLLQDIEVHVRWYH